MGRVIPFRKVSPNYDTKDKLKHSLVEMGFYDHVSHVPDVMVDFMLHSFQLCYNAGLRKGERNG